MTFPIVFTPVTVSADNSDFGPVPANVTYDNNDEKVLQVPIHQDDEEEADETFLISMTISPPSLIETDPEYSIISVIIIDDDGSRGKKMSSL